MCVWPAYYTQKKQIQRNPAIQRRLTAKLMNLNLEYPMPYHISFSLHKSPINISGLIDLILGT